MPELEQTDVVEGELVPVERSPITLFNTNDPRVALERMSDLAKVLVDLVRSQGLAVRIGGREHLRVEAWRALAGMVGVHAVTAWSRVNENGDGYVVRVEALTRAGELVGASEAECSRGESTWSRRDAYALRAMAETRATSRALRGPLGQVVVLAGFEPAGVEEVSADSAASSRAELETSGPIPENIRPTEQQIAELKSLVGLLDRIDPATDWRARITEITGAPWNHTTTTMAKRAIEKLQAAYDELADVEPAA